ncbi:hypothetical protein SK128_000777 [Halocaridina rubra]|uniref:Uncharacterized protein n=1 Tax=Halocaridina rubra TaxID=373956 RepID=A0AAN8X2W6_HALRR
MSIYIYHVFIWGVLTSLVMSQGLGNGETNAGTSIYSDEDIASTTEPTQTPEDDEVTTEPILVPQSPSKPELRNNLKHTLETGNSCPKIGTVTNIRNSLIKCQCQGYEVLVDGNCTTYEGDVVVDAEEEHIFTKPSLLLTLMRDETFHTDVVWHMGHVSPFLCERFHIFQAGRFQLTCHVACHIQRAT